MPQPDLKEFLTWPFGLFVLGCYFITFVIRKVVDRGIPKIGQAYFWIEVVLPILPILVGAVAGVCMKKYPVLEGLSGGTRLIYGAVAGGVSTIGYRIFKAIVKKQFNVDTDAHDDESPTLRLSKSDLPKDPTEGLPKLRGTGYSGPDGADLEEPETQPEPKP